MAKTTGKVVTLTRSGGSIWTVNIDGKGVAFAGNTGQRKVAPGDHTIQFFVQGVPLSSFSLDITAPQEAKIHFGGTFDAGMKDMGSGWFTVN
jgi:hypothetical protein